MLTLPSPIPPCPCPRSWHRSCRGCTPTPSPHPQHILSSLQVLRGLPLLSCFQVQQHNGAAMAGIWEGLAACRMLTRLQLTGSYWAVPPGAMSAYTPAPALASAAGLLPQAQQLAVLRAQLALLAHLPQLMLPVDGPAPAGIAPDPAPCTGSPHPHPHPAPTPGGVAAAAGPLPPPPPPPTGSGPQGGGGAACSGLGALTSLRQLDLSCNALTQLPAGLSTLARLTSLALDHNR